MTFQQQRTARINIERSKTNQESRKLEEIYRPKIKKIFKQIIKEYGNDLYHLHEAERKYGSQIKVIIKSLVTKSYLLGLDYISKATGEPHLISLSSQDLTQIMLQADEYYRQFWRLITKYVQVTKNRQMKSNNMPRTAKTYHNNTNATITDSFLLTDEIFNVSDFEDDRLLDEDIVTELIISGILTTAIALGTLLKYNEYKTEKELIDQELLTEEYTEGLFTDIELEEKFVFATALDDKVCPICEPHEGEEFDIDDPDIVTPKLHIGCRCRLLLKIGDVIINK